MRADFTLAAYARFSQQATLLTLQWFATCEFHQLCFLPQNVAKSTPGHLLPRKLRPDIQLLCFTATWDPQLPEAVKHAIRMPAGDYRPVPWWGACFGVALCGMDLTVGSFYLVGGRVMIFQTVRTCHGINLCTQPDLEVS